MLRPEMMERIKGCLVGAAIGAELGFAKRVAPQRFAIAQPQDLLGLRPQPVSDYREEPPAKRSLIAPGSRTTRWRGK